MYIHYFFNKIIANPVLYLHFCFKILVVTVSDNCATGFPDINLLTSRAAQIEDDLRVGSRIKDGELRILSHMRFNCTGKITSLLLGVDVRSDTDSFPTVSLWTQDMNDQMVPVYTKVDGSERSIVLGPSNFSTRGVFEFPLAPPMEFENGNMLGWLQQGGVIRMYEIEKANFITDSFAKPVNVVLEIGERRAVNDQALLIYPITG